MGEHRRVAVDRMIPNMGRAAANHADYILDLESGIIREADPAHQACVGSHLCNRCRAEVRGEALAWLHALAVSHDSPLQIRPWEEHILDV